LDIGRTPGLGPRTRCLAAKWLFEQFRCHGSGWQR